MNKSDLGAELGSALFRVAKLAKRSVRADLEELGLTMPQAMLLHHLAADGGRRSARELGRECDMLASTATGVIDRLERDGYVRRERDLDDRRVVWVQLTDKGEALQGKLPAFQTAIGRAFMVLSVGDLEQVLAAVHRVEAAIEEGGR